MLSPAILKLGIAVLAMGCAGGLAYVFLYPLLSGENDTAKRLSKLTEARGPRRVENRVDQAARRKQIEESLKEAEAKQARLSKRLTIAQRLDQAGLSWSRNTFLIFSAGAALIAAAIVFTLTQAPLVALAAGFGTGVALPNWFLTVMRKRRLAKFINEFPNAVEVIVRGVKAGLPLGDCLRICAQEAQEPVRSEFRKIIETQTLGIPLAEAVEGLYIRVPLPEANFFCIVVSVQQRSGGNLSEVLGNLAKVLRDRKKMKQKINAMSQEAKASAAIIGALPAIVMVLVYMTSPDYIKLLWTNTTGQYMLAGSGMWMTAGVLVMRKMINFDF